MYLLELNFFRDFLKKIDYFLTAPILSLPAGRTKSGKARYASHKFFFGWTRIQTLNLSYFLHSIGCIEEAFL